ncbi:MAG: hypothetical protein L3J71_02800 [Victivallaceae bacterium]|nr:hypothetical protein [Victivallaceae bacterium]
MTGNELIALFEKGQKRYHLIGGIQNGVIAGLDLEGRLFTIINGEVANRVNPEAILGITTRDSYLNPGGDGLWPAPEGTCLGYEYSTDKWRVPPGLTSAKFKVIETDLNQATIEAEVDLINASGRGIATIFRRAVTVLPASNMITVKVIESIEYIGSKTLSSQECLLAPWTLCQFDSGPGCEVFFPEVDDKDVWDMYDSSNSHRFNIGGFCHITTDATLRYQIGLSEKVPWIELILPEQNLTVKRYAMPLSASQKYIDIIDAPPEEQPSDKGVRYSIYSDTDGFMEIEAAGGCPDVITPGCVMNVEVITEFKTKS